MTESYLQRAQAQVQAGDLQSAQALALLSIAESLEAQRPTEIELQMCPQCLETTIGAKERRP